MWAEGARPPPPKASARSTVARSASGGRKALAERQRDRRRIVPLAGLRFRVRREVRLRSNSDVLASTTGALGLVRRAHALALLIRAPRITRTEVDATVSLRPTSGFALRGALKVGARSARSADMRR